MKKKGFTLIELIVTLNILLLVLGVTQLNLSIYNNRKINIKINKYSYELKTLLSYGKSYCRKYKAIGSFFVDPKNNIVVFEVLDKESFIRRVIYLEDDFSLSYNYKGSLIEINEQGYIKNSCTLKIIYKGKAVKEITIGVGNDIIGITEGDAIE